MKFALPRLSSFGGGVAWNLIRAYKVHVTHILANEFRCWAVQRFLQPQTIVMPIVSMLLLLAGDIETNPGPHESSGENNNLPTLRNMLNEPLIR